MSAVSGLLRLLQAWSLKDTTVVSFFEYLFILICNFIFSCNNKVYILCTFVPVLQVLPAERKTDVSRGTSAIGAVPHLLSHPFRSRIRQLPLFRPESRRSSDRRDRPGYAGENACTEYGSEIQGPFRAALCQDILTQRKHPISCAARSGGIFIPAGNGSVLAESPWIAYFTAVLHLQQRMPAKLSVSSTRTFRPYKNNSADGPGILCSLRFPSFIRMPAASLQYRKRQRQPFRKTSGTAFSRPRRRGHTKLSRPLSTDVPHRWYRYSIRDCRKRQSLITSCPYILVFPFISF